MTEYIDLMKVAIGTIGSILVAYLVNYANIQRKDKESIKREINLQKKALDVNRFIANWGSFFEDLHRLCETTNLDRFVIFIAFNGKATPKWTNSIFQFRQGKQEYISYKHFELDTDYVKRLKIITGGVPMHIRTAEIKDSAIKSVYEAEEIKESYWVHIKSEDIDDDSRAITYCSCATHDDEGFDEKTLTRLKILVDGLRYVYGSGAHDRRSVER